MSDADTQNALREMSKEIGGLSATMKTMLDTWRAQEASASAGRREVYQKLEAVKERVTSLDTRVGTLSKEVSDIAPSVQAFEDARQQAVGAQKLGKIIWAILFSAGGAIGGAATWALANWVNITPK